MSCLGASSSDFLWCVYLIVRLAIHVMNRAPEETINRKSPSKHARTGMVGAVPTTGSMGTQKAAYGERCGPRTAPTPCPVQRPHRSPYGPRTVLPVPVPYRFARMGPVPFCPYRSRTVLPVLVPNRFARCFFLFVFFIVESANEGLPLQKLSPFAIQKAFQAIAEL